MELTSRKINITTSILLLLYRGLIVVFEEDYTRDSWINLFIPILFIIIFMFKNKTLDSMFYTLLAVVIMLLGRYDNINGAFFLFLSIYDNKKTWNIYLNIIIFLVSLALKPYLYVVVEGTSSAYSYIIGMLYILSHLYVRFWDTPVISHNEAEKKGLTPEQRATIPVIMKGLSHKDSAKILNITRSAYSERVKVLRKRQGVTSDFLLALSLVKDGIISVNVLTDDKIENSSVNKSDNL